MHAQAFDPGWRGGRARGAEDAFTSDTGADPTGVIARYVAPDSALCAAGGQAPRCAALPLVARWWAFITQILSPFYTGHARRLELALDGRCDGACDDAVRHVLSVHVRGKYASADFLGGDLAEQEAQDAQPAFRAATYLIRKLGILFDRVAVRRRELEARRVGA